MAGGKKKKEKEMIDPRIEATGAIWGAAIAMMAIGLPIAAIFKSPVVFFAVLGAAAASSIGLWAFAGGSRSRDRAAAGSSDDLVEENAALRSRLAEVEERLANVETISSFEMRLAADERARRDSVSAVEGLPDTIPGTPAATTRKAENEPG